VSIWDKLPPEERRKLVNERLTPGRVLLLHCKFTVPPKEKFVVVAAVVPSPLFFVINSKVNDYIRKRDWLMQCQVEIRHEEHSFLNHRSFIDCTQVYQIPLSEVYAQIEREITRLKDEIRPEVRHQIIAAVKFSKTLSAKHKTDILLSLDDNT